MGRHLFAGIELGGTKCVCILGTGPDDIREQIRIPTRQPAETLAEIEVVLTRWQTRHPVAALGVASFGPLDLRPDSAKYGYIVSTTKPGWSNTDVAVRLAHRLDIPMAVDTDVNAAAFAEGSVGAAQGLEDFAYITVGTGIGVGLIVAGHPPCGFAHAELGHIRVVRVAGDDWPGHCSFHGDCLEGLASGPAIRARTGRAAEDLPPDHPAWNLVAHSLGQLLHVLVLGTAPRRIILAGGVVNDQQHLLPRVREELATSLGGYIVADEVTRDLERYVVPAECGAQAGPFGALLLAGKALHEQEGASARWSARGRTA